MKDIYDTDYQSPDEAIKIAIKPWVLLFIICGTALVTCLLFFVLLRWPLTARVLRPVFIGSDTALAPPAATRTSTPIPGSTDQSRATPSPIVRILATPTPAPGDQPSNSLKPELLASLRQMLLEAINTDRGRHNLRPIAWESAAAAAGQKHAEDMLANGYFSHWNLQGLGPEHRYALADGRNSVRENLYKYRLRYETGAAAPISDWATTLRDAEAALMDSPGHRDNILDPLHTHAGIGIAYDDQRGELYLAQEFTGHWADVEPLPRELPIGATLAISGTLLNGSTNPLINMTYQPFPTLIPAMNTPNGAYTSVAEVYEATPLNLTGNHFATQVQLGKNGRTGLYSVRLWVDVDRTSTLASELIVWVR